MKRQGGMGRERERESKREGAEGKERVGKREAECSTWIFVQGPPVPRYATVSYNSRLLQWSLS